MACLLQMDDLLAASSALDADVLTAALSGFAPDCQGIFRVQGKGQLAVTKSGVIALGR
jgi:hypothetical protein